MNKEIIKKISKYLGIATILITTFTIGIGVGACSGSYDPEHTQDTPKQIKKLSNSNEILPYNELSNSSWVVPSGLTSNIDYKKSCKVFGNGTETIQIDNNIYYINDITFLCDSNFNICSEVFYINGGSLLIKSGSIITFGDLSTLYNKLGDSIINMQSWVDSFKSSFKKYEKNAYIGFGVVDTTLNDTFNNISSISLNGKELNLYKDNDIYNWFKVGDTIIIDIKYKNNCKSIFTQVGISSNEQQCYETPILTYYKNNMQQIKTKLIYDNIGNNTQFLFNDSIHTLNALTGTSWILNSELKKPDTKDNKYPHLSIENNESAIDGTYLYYNYNLNLCLDKNISWKPNGIGNYCNGLMSFRDNLVIYGGNQPTTESIKLYDFNSNNYYNKYGLPSRLITFSNNFNNDNLSLWAWNNQGEGYGIYFDFYNWLTENATQLTPEQMDIKQDGYTMGFNDGYKMSSTSTSWISSVFKGVDSILSIEIFPNFKLWYMISIPLMFGVVLLVFKFIK